MQGAGLDLIYIILYIVAFGPHAVDGQVCKKYTLICVDMFPNYHAKVATPSPMSLAKVCRAFPAPGSVEWADI